MKAVDTSVRGDIQGLRAIAVGLVIAAHLATYEAPGLRRLAGGFIGVDVFFVLSGYLITSLLVREVERSGRVSLVGFYARRARRILPAATVTLAVVIAYAAARLPRSEFSRVVPDAWWSALFAANWHFAHTGTSYFDPTYLSPLQHFWSLAVEEQFYLVWPLAMLLLAPRLSRRALGWLLAATIAVSLAWSVHVTHADPTAAYFSTPARVHELAIGALLAVVGLPRLAAPVRLVLGLAGLALLVGATLGLGSGAAFPGWEALLPTGATALLLISGNGAPNAVTRLLSVAPMRYLGDISYSLYLWHFPVIVLLGARVSVEAGLMVLLAVASYHLVEQPFRRRTGLLAGVLTTAPRALVLWPSALALVLATTLVARGWSDHEQHTQLEASTAWWSAHPGARSSTPDLDGVAASLHRAVALDHAGAPVPPALEPADETQDYWGAAYGCFADYGQTTSPDCAYGDTGSDVIVAAVGDSHMGMWLAALDALGKARHLRIVPLVKVSCAAYDVYQPGRQMTQPECDAYRSWTLDRLHELRPDAIVTTARGKLFMHPRDGKTSDEQWREGVRTTLSAFTTVTPHVTVLGDIPSRPDPQDCLTRPGVRLADCESHARGKEIRSNAVTRAVTADLGLAWVPTVALACDGDICPPVAEGLRVYHDTSHLSLAWVRHVSRAFATLVADAPVLGDRS